MLGGGLSLKWFATALVSGSSFTDCSSRGDGASVHAWRGSNVTALSTSFLRGTSSASGGGIGGEAMLLRWPPDVGNPEGLCVAGGSVPASASA